LAKKVYLFTLNPLMISYEFRVLGYRLVMIVAFQLFSLKKFPISNVADCNPPTTG